MKEAIWMTEDDSDFGDKRRENLLPKHMLSNYCYSGIDRQGHSSLEPCPMLVCEGFRCFEEFSVNGVLNFPTPV
jgi:hypothetical protein